MGSYVSDKIGRRRAMSFFCVIFSIGILLQVASVSSWVQFMIGRLVAGWGSVG
jgi:MFS family permease